MKKKNVRLKIYDAPTMLEKCFPEECRPSVRWAQQLAAKQKIPSIRLNGKILFDLDEVRAWINSNRRPARQ